MIFSVCSFGKFIKAQNLSCPYFLKFQIEHFKNSHGSVSFLQSSKHLSRHLHVQSQQYKHQNNVWNLLKLNNKVTRSLYCYLWTAFTHCSSVSIFGIEQVNIQQSSNLLKHDIIKYKYVFQKFAIFWAILNNLP